MQDFAEKLIAWQQQHGRHDLPWQQSRDPYAIWVSEIMLQQTQVSAVIGYYARFMARFPDIASLANATQDEVLQYWSGLGYYSRARNLHHAAQTIMQQHAGKFPQDFESIQALKGIGRSTAAAIAVFAFDQKHTILDGNVKRVLARLLAIRSWPGLPKVEAQLWQAAEALLPDQQLPAYIQGLMDFGATLCTRSKPDCSRCPMQHLCQAYQQGIVQQLPVPKPRKALPEKTTVMLIVSDGNHVLLERRPQQGIWAGLWSLPEIASSDIPAETLAQRYGLHAEASEPMPLLTHSFTHYKLHIIPQPMWLNYPNTLNDNTVQWFRFEQALHAAIPTPVRKILQLSMQKPTSKIRR